MPHQCTGCGHTFADGSKEMLSGCPECGGNKFQFRPSAEDLPDQPADPPEEEAPSRPEPESSSVAETVGRATTKMRDLVSSGPDTPDESAEPGGDSGPEPKADPSPEPAADTTAEPAASAPEQSESAVSNPLSMSDDESETEPETAGKSDGDPDPNAAWPSESADADATATGPETGGQPATDDDGEIIDADARRSADEASDEDLAQASARSDVVPEEELPETDEPSADAAAEPSAETVTGGSGLESAEATASGPGPDVDGRVVSEPDEEEPDIAELREQLNDQFESIKIVEPGQYELNLMELYDREEYIIALQENGRYVIQVPEQWMGEDPGDR